MTTFKILRFSLPLVFIEAVYSLWLLLSIPGDPGNTLALGLSPARLAMALALVLAAAASAALFFILRSDELNKRLASRTLSVFTRKWVFGLLLATISAALLFVLNRHFAPAIYEARILRLYPIMLFALLFGLHLLAFLLLAGGKNTWQLRALLFTLSLVLLSFYLSGALNFSTVNSNPGTSDQQVQIDFARFVRQSGFRFTGGRNFMPAFAYLQAIFLDVEAGVEELFALGKQINILLSMLFLVGSFFLFKGFLRPMSAYLLTLIAAFSLYIYKAPYYQPELLFYSLFFLVFLLIARQILRPSWREALLLGVLLGLAHLTKAAVLPAVLLFIVVRLIRALQAFRRNRARKSAASLQAQLGNLSIALVLFLITVGPYILESKQRYGQYFYNVNTTFYVWYDSWRDAKEGTRAHGDNLGWPDMPEDKIPSAGKYFRSHSLSEVLTRLSNGIQSQTNNLLQPFSRFSYPLIYAVFLLLAAWLARVQLGALFRQYGLLLFFAIAFFSGYLLLYAFYGPIADYADYRFTYSLYLPFLFSIFVALEKLLEPERLYKLASFQLSGAGWQRALHSLVALLLSYEILFELPSKLTIFDWYGK